MDLNTKELFEDGITKLALEIKELVEYNPSAFDLKISNKMSNEKKQEKFYEKALEIAYKICDVEIFFTLVSELNKNLNQNVQAILNKDKDVNNNEESFITLCETLEDLTSLFYNTRPTYWHYLDFKGKVIEQRIRCLFYKWGYKYQLALDMISYFEELNKLLEISYESGRNEFTILVDSIRIRENLKDIKVEDILKEKIFSKDGIYYLSNARFNLAVKEESLDVDEVSADERHYFYSRDVFKNLKPKEDISIKGKKAIDEYLSKPSAYSIVAKTTQDEYFITNNRNQEIVREAFKLLDNIEPLSVEKRDKVTIDITLDELYEGAKELDADLDEFKRFREKNLKEIDFIKVEYEKKDDKLTFNGFNNFVGMVNTGKTNFMVVTAYALAKKGYKVCIVLRDNQDVFEQLENINKNNTVKAVSLVGPTSKVFHIEKILSSNRNKVEKNRFVNGDENILDMINDDRLEYGTYTCPIKALFDVKSDATSDIYITDDSQGKILCNSLFLRKNTYSRNSKLQKHTDIKITCPFSRKCDSLKVNEYIPEGDIFLTNMASFIKTEMNHVYFAETDPVSKFINDVADLVLVDESDAMQFQFDSAFSDNSPIYNDINNPSILERLKEYKEDITGNVDKFREHNELLFRLTKTEMIASEILDKFTQNKVPGYLKNSPVVSRKIFNTLSWLLSRKPDLLQMNVECLNGVDVKKYDKEDETEEEELSRIKLNKFFKDANQIIYQSCNQGLTTKEYIFAEMHEEEYMKYKDWFSYLEAVGYSNTKKIHLRNIYRSIINENIIYPETQNYIESNEQAKEFVMELLSLAILLTSIEGDLNKITSNTGYVKSVLRDISKKDVPNIPLSRSHTSNYRGLTSRCPLGLYFGLRYNKDKKSLDMISWEGVGRDLFYQYDELWKYKENNENAGTNIAVFSGTSFMPTSPLYHILKDVDYLMKSNIDKPLAVNYDYKPMKDDNGKVIVNSGSKKSKEEVANKIYRSIAKGLTADKYDTTVLSRYLEDYTFEGRKRLIISVGNYKDALRLASFLHESNNDPNVKVAALYREGTDTELQFSLPIERRINKDTMKKIENTDFNIVVVPQSAIQRGINMLKTQSDESGNGEDKIVASFGGILKTNRDYQVPDNHIYAVARVSHVLEKKKQELFKQGISSNYSLSKEVSILFKLADKTYTDYYSTKYFADLDKDERNMLIGDLFVEDIQFSGRTVRGNVNTSIVLLDGAFFRNHSKGLIDDETTSTVVAMKNMCDGISKESTTNKFLMDSLYGPFLKGMEDLIDRVKNDKI